MEYVAPFGSPDPDAPYVDRNTPGAVAGSKVPAAAVEHPMREIEHAIEEAGIVPSRLDLTQLARAIRAIARGNYQVFSTPGTTNWVCPAGVNRVKVRMWGAGGGGGGASAASNNTLASGGGGGAYAEKVVAVTPGVPYAITVGASGARGTVAPLTPGAAGGFSSFANQVTALGGTGGQAADGAIQTTPGVGGTATGADFSVAGYQGGIAWQSADTGGRNVSAQGGGAFQSAYTPLIIAGQSSAAVGSQGMYPGGGGGGGMRGGAGGFGSNGLVILEY